MTPRMKVSECQSISTLQAEYEHGNAVLRRKTIAIGCKYSHWRSVSGDGNCFYRGACLGLLESLRGVLLAAYTTLEESRHMSGTGSTGRRDCSHDVPLWGADEAVAPRASDGNDDAVELVAGEEASGNAERPRVLRWGDAMQRVMGREWVLRLHSGTFTPSEDEADEECARISSLWLMLRELVAPSSQWTAAVEAMMAYPLAAGSAFDLAAYGEGGTLEMLVKCSRHVVAEHILSHEDDFAPFACAIGMGVREYCEEHVRPMHKECEEASLAAFARALRCKFDVVCLAPDTARVETITYTPGDAVTSEFIATLLFRPGHYDALYLRDR